MSKTIIITFNNGEIYEVPADIVAQSRAEYYSQIDGVEYGSDEYQKEYQYSYSDNYELLDWINNNMNWSDISKFAKRIDLVNYDYEKNFINADKKIG